MTAAGAGVGGGFFYKDLSRLVSYYLPPSQFSPLNFPISLQGFLFQILEIGELALRNHP